MMIRQRIVPIFLILTAFVLGALVVEMLWGVEGVSNQNLYKVVLKSGREVTGEIFKADSPAQLRISTNSHNIQIVRTVDLSSVQSIFLGNKKIDLHPFDTADLKAQEEVKRKRTVVRKPVIPDSTFEVQDSRVASINVHAHLSQWDQDIENDGLLLEITGVNRSGESIPFKGTVAAELYSTKRHSFNAIPHGKGFDFERIGRWVHNISPEKPLRFKLPFQADNPERNLRLGESGYLVVKVTVPGIGVFHRRIEPIRIRSFSPARDLKELQRVKYH